MDFSIPDTTTDISSTQQNYTLYNIHINGIHHCSLRYSQLFTFNEELHRLLPNVMVQIALFPPKKFFNLGPKDTDERRVLLEHYLQSIAQNKYIISSSYFNEYFLVAQRETFSRQLNDNSNGKINLKMTLLNQHELIVENVSISDNTTRVLDACASKIQVAQDLMAHFALYLYTKNKEQLHILRPLYDLESPYFSLEQTKKIHAQACIVLKKSYWDVDVDLKLINDRRARNLLFIQAEYEMQQSESFYANDIYRQLEALRENNSFKDYVLLARTSRFYGHIFLRQCSILYPVDDSSKQKLSQCLLALGNNEIVCCFNIEEKKNINEIVFKVIRIRCWKITRTRQETSIAIEYLIKKEKLQWITIHTEQAALVSMCLQSMVDEILTKRKGSVVTTTTTVATKPKEPSANSTRVGNGLATRRESDVERLNNIAFDRGVDDDDL